MPPLSLASRQALDRLRSYESPSTIWATLPLSRKAAVLILLFADQKGELRVVLTMRSSTLSSYSGHAALPGGKAEEGEEAVQVARREAFEEIGLPETNSKLPRPFTVEHLTEMPTNLAQTELVVRPCLAFLNSYDEVTGKTASVEDTLLPKLDAREVAAVFTAPFRNFLHSEDLPEQENLPGQSSEWYKGSWTNWHECKWRMHNFFVPVTNQTVFKPKRNEDQIIAADNLEGLDRYRVFGMTARIITDAARVAYGHEPTFEHNSHFGDEDMIRRLRKIGRLGDRRKPNDVLTGDIMKRAAKL